MLIANVLMRQNAGDYPAVRALAADLGVECTIDPTITPKMDGDRSIVGLRISAPQLLRVLHGQVAAARQRVRTAVSTRRGDAGRAAVQRRAHRLLHLAVRRRLSVRAVPAANRQRAPPAIRRDLDAFTAVDRRSEHPDAGSADLFDAAATCPRARGARASPTWKATCAGRHRPTARNRRCGRWRRPRVATTHRPATKECSHERRETRSGRRRRGAAGAGGQDGRIKSPRSRASRSSKPWRSRAARSTRRAVPASSSRRTRSTRHDARSIRCGRPGGTRRCLQTRSAATDGQPARDGTQHAAGHRAG